MEEKKINSPIDDALQQGQYFAQMHDSFRAMKRPEFKDNFALFEMAEHTFAELYSRAQAAISNGVFDGPKFRNNIDLLQEFFWILCNVYINTYNGATKGDFWCYDLLHFAFDRLLYIKALFNVTTYNQRPPSYRRGIRKPGEEVPVSTIVAEVYGFHDFSSFEDTLRKV
jgi:hypothetical protein